MWFDGIELHFIEIDGEQWIRRRDAMRALGYVVEGKSSIFIRWRSHFTPDMARIVSLPTAGGPQQTWLLSMRGAQLVCMLSRTATAPAFRLWLLDAMASLHAATVPGLSARHQ